MNLCILTDDDGIIYSANVTYIEIEQIIKCANEIRESEFEI